MKKVVITALVAGAAVICSCSSQQSQSGMVKGNAAKLDTLSYALGSNIASSIKYQMPDLPLSYSEMSEGLNAAALTNNAMSHEDAIQVLQTYFMETRAIRAQIVEEKRNTADSIALANGASDHELMEARMSMPADADMFESEEQRSEVSYAFGIDLGTNLRSEELPLQTYWINKGMSDVSNNEALMSEDEVLAYLQNYFMVVRPAELSEEIVAKMAEIEKQPGVVKTESGLMYRIDKEGDNSVVATVDTDVVRVNYTGSLVRNGKVFDSSRYEDTPTATIEMLKMSNPDGYMEDRPIEFPLNGVIPGWTEGMKLVGKGGRISLWIPADLAYGSRGAGRDIGPNEALYFDIELLDVNPQAE